MDNGFIFGDRATWDFPIMKVEKYPSARSGIRKYQTYSVPGRNGDLHIDEGAFQNYTQPYECYYHTDRMTNETAHEVKAWLLGYAGYRRLIDAYDPTHYRLATVLDELEIQNILNAYGRFTVNFNCDPRSFLISGDYPQTFTAPGVLRNEGFPALPVITVYGAGDGTLTVGSRTVQIFDLEENITLDCETENAYRGSQNLNSKISAPEFPTLLHGDNPISWSGGVERVEIIPRWWDL